MKIYSLLLDYFVIYDGRVGALGLLVRQFCEESGRSTVPHLLAFAYGQPKEGKNPRPVSNVIRAWGCTVPALIPGNDHRHCLHAMRASWLLREALAVGETPFSSGECGFHELAAGLFMVGYDLGAPGVP